MSLFRPSSILSPFFPFGSSSDLDDFPSRRPASLLNAVQPWDFFQRESNFVAPRIDIHEEDQRYVLTAEVPGVKKEDIKVSIDAEHRRLTIEGQMKSEYTSGGEQQIPVEGGEGAEKVKSKEVAAKGEGRVGTPLISERVFGSFSRTFTMPIAANLADEKNVRARYDNGLLKLEIPKKTEALQRARQVTIEDVNE
ncbi:HSP20-like chaperone [Violaceomyces palustris]|uniref:HSP20-like chaperone n=1 Tax=Violaceomyces palustris TaxID=1673888 RepID=A0ACD0NTB7_9BASI|nr:HSP20-like chaperone [Violaceomyces palustris]